MSIKVSSYVEYSTPGDDLVADQLLIDQARKWVHINVMPIVVISATRSVDFYKKLPYQAGMGLKIGSVLATKDFPYGDLYNVDGWKIIFDKFAQCVNKEKRIENESLLRAGNANAGYWKSGIDKAKFEDTLSKALGTHKISGLVWQTAFFNPASLGLYGADVDKCLVIEKDIATVVRKVLNASFVCAKLSKPPLVPNPGKFPNPKYNNDWDSVAAETIAAEFADTTHVLSTHVYDEIGYGVHSRRFWQRGEYASAYQLAVDNGINMCLDAGNAQWAADDLITEFSAFVPHLPPHPPVHIITPPHVVPITPET